MKSSQGCHPDIINIVSDDGSENKGDVLAWVNQNPLVNKLIAGKDFPFSNSMPESVHHLLKTYFSPNKIYHDANHLQNDFVEFSNHHWYPLEFHGLSPIKVLKNGIIDKHRFSKQIKQAQKQRVFDNTNVSFCGNCS